MTPRGSIELRCGRITKFRGQIRSVDNRVALYKAEVTFKVNYFLLVNAVNLCDQHETCKICGEIFCSLVKILSCAWIPFEMTRFCHRNFHYQ